MSCSRGPKVPMDVLLVLVKLASNPAATVWHHLARELGHAVVASRKVQ